MDENLIKGVIIGFLFAGFVGFTLGRIREARVRFRQRSQPLDSFPDSLQPRLTPIRIVRRSCLAVFSCLFWLAVLSFSIIGFFYALCNWEDINLINIIELINRICGIE